MIPLDPEYEQDIARFPQKIAEYCSTSVPIITTNVGEVEFYFTDKTCLKSKFSAESFAENMVWIEQHKKEALQIGEESYGLGLNKFEYSKSCEDIFAFLKSLYL